MSPLRSELRKLMSLALPAMGAQVGIMLMGTVDTVMVARLSVDALAAAAIANAWIYGWLLFGQGVVFGIDPIVTQAHGAGHGERVALAFQRGVVLALAISLPIRLAHPDPRTQTSPDQFPRNQEAGRTAQDDLQEEAPRVHVQVGVSGSLRESGPQQEE